jgi:exopolysaccharide production protein ExoZ
VATVDAVAKATNIAAAAPQPASAGRLDWVELGRGLAALVVVVFHASSMMRETQYSGKIFMHDWFFWGFLGVDFFFVLSGFIILYVHFNDIDRPGRALRYGWRRVARIFPTYWIVFGAALLLNLVLQNDKAPMGGLWLAQQLSLWPGYDAWLGPAWTLRFELLFYGIFSVLLFRRSLGVALLGLWLACILIAGVQSPGFLAEENRRNFINLLTSPYNLNFFFGMALAYATRTGKGLNALTVLFALLGAAFVAWSWRHGIDWHSFIRYPGCGMVCAALLGLLLMVNKSDMKLHRVFIWLGGISFSLYLSHVLFMGYFLAALSRLGLYQRLPEPLIFLGEIAVAIICASLVFRLLEMPVQKWAHTKFNN